MRTQQPKFLISALAATTTFLSAGSAFVWAQDVVTQAPDPAPVIHKDMRGNLLPKDYDIQKVAQSKINLDVKNANLTDVVRAVSDATAASKVIEIRYPAFERISLKVEQMPMEDVLRGVATLNRLNLYVLPDRFVIAPYFMLSEEERKKVIKPTFESSTPPVITKEEAQRNLEKLTGSRNSNSTKEK